MTIIWCMVPEIWSMTDRERFVILDRFSKFWKTKKRLLEISSLYTSVPKIMIICYTVPEIWHVTNLIVIFHFGLFLPPFTPLTAQKSKFKKMRKNLKISSFSTCVPKTMIRWCRIPEIWCTTDGWTDRRWVPHLKNQLRKYNFKTRKWPVGTLSLGLWQRNYQLFPSLALSLEFTNGVYKYLMTTFSLKAEQMKIWASNYHKYDYKSNYFPILVRHC